MTYRPAIGLPLIGIAFFAEFALGRTGILFITVFGCVLLWAQSDA